MSKIKQDSHSLYVLVGGYIFRPVTVSRYSWAPNVNTRFVIGEEVNARHLGGTGLGVLKTEAKGEETWFSHGGYTDDQCKRIKSDLLWTPNV